MEKPVREKKPLNLVIRFGLWVTVGAALVWVGGLTYSVLHIYIPFAAALGVFLVILGSVQEYKSTQHKHTEAKSDSPTSGKT